MKYFCMPADFKSKTIDDYDRLNQSSSDSKVIETYGQITIDNYFESGRAIDLLPKVDLIDLAEYIAYSKSKNIDFNYTINASFMKNKEFTERGLQEIHYFLEKLSKIGVRSLTIALPSLIELVKATKFDFIIKASTICQITNVNKALWYQKMGIQRMVVGESINRDFAALKRIRKACGDGIEVIVNSICHNDCINRMFHYNQAAEDSCQMTSEASMNYYPNRCLLRRYEKMSNILRLSWIRPEDIKYYNQMGINYFKLQGRQQVLHGDPVRAVTCYFQEKFDGNLLDLLEMFSPNNYFRIQVDNQKLDGYIAPFVEHESFCKSDCLNCNYCETYAQKSVNPERYQEVLQLFNDFFQSRDPYLKMLAASNEAPKSPEMDEFNIDFNIQ